MLRIIAYQATKQSQGTEDVHINQIVVATMEEDEVREAFDLFCPESIFSPPLYLQLWRQFQIFVAGIGTIAIPNQIIMTNGQDEVYCEAYRIASRFNLSALQQLFTIQGENSIILCRNLPISFSQFYSSLQRLHHIRQLLKDPSGNWQVLLQYVFSEGVKTHLRLNKGKTDYNPQILINLLTYIQRAEETSFHLQSFLGFLIQLPEGVQLQQIISQTRPFVNYVVLTVNNRCRLIEENFNYLPYYQQATQVYRKSKTKKQFALNCISLTYFFQSNGNRKPVEKIRDIQNVYVTRNWMVIKCYNTERRFQLIERLKEDNHQQLNGQPVQVSPMKVRAFYKDIKPYHRIFYSLFQDTELHAKFQMMIEAIQKMDQRDIYWPFVQQDKKYSFQEYVCSIFVAYNLILNKSGIHYIKDIFSFNLVNQTLTCYFKKYNSQLNQFDLVPIILRIQDYFNVHTNDISLTSFHQIDMRNLWNFIQKRMVTEAVKYFLGGENVGLDIRLILSLFLGYQYNSLMVRVESLCNPDDKKRIIESFLSNYHFYENPENQFKHFSIHRKGHVGLFVNAHKWQFPEKEQPQDISCNSNQYSSGFDLIVHNINQTSKFNRLRQYAQTFRTQIINNYPKMQISGINFYEYNLYNIVCYIN